MTFPKDDHGRYWIPARASEPRVEIDCSCGWGLNAPKRLLETMTDRHAYAHNKGIDGLAAAATWDIRHIPAEHPEPEPAACLEQHAALDAENVFGAQGRTVDTAHLVAGEDMTRDLLYTGMIRSAMADAPEPEAGL
jgi:hypothetical protein